MSFKNICSWFGNPVPSVIGLLFCAAISVFAGPPTSDLKALNGVWIPVAAELAGKPMPDAVLKTITLKLDNGRYEVTVEGEPLQDTGTVALDSAAVPAAMKINGVKGPNAGKLFLAIYELKEDTLRVCYDLSGGKTPSEFKTKPGTQLYLVTYHRKRAENASQSGSPAK